LQRVAWREVVSPFDGVERLTPAQAELAQLFSCRRLAADYGTESVAWSELRALVSPAVSDVDLVLALPSANAHLSADRTVVHGLGVRSDEDNDFARLCARL
jgi:hypothetical protein